MGWRAGEPEPNDEDDIGSIRRGIQELLWRREKDDRAGYSTRGTLRFSVEDGVEGAAGDAPPLASSFLIEAAAWNDAVDGGELLLANALEEQRPQVSLSGAYLSSLRYSSGMEERTWAISARRAAPSSTGGTRTPPALNIHAPGTRMLGGAGYSAS